MSIFEKRIVFKPFEYPELKEYKQAMNHSYWLVSEWNFISDIQDFNTKLNEEEKEIVRRALLAISQIEVAVKKFWAKIGDRFPKAEFDQVGITFAEAEVRHSDAYSHLLEILNLNDEFDNLLKNPVIQGRVDYLTKYLNSENKSNEQYLITLTLFSLFIENVSLFSQFAVIKSFNKYKNVLKDIDNVIQATQLEEQIHALFGIKLIELIKKEYPEWFNSDFYEKINNACIKAFEAESKIIDWIFENGKLSFLSKECVIEFIKNRFNESVISIGGQKIFDINYQKLEQLEWFNEELKSETHIDFFYKKSTAYSKRTKSINASDLF